MTRDLEKTDRTARRRTRDLRRWGRVGWLDVYLTAARIHDSSSNGIIRKNRASRQHSRCADRRTV